MMIMASCYASHRFSIFSTLRTQVSIHRTGVVLPDRTGHQLSAKAQVRARIRAITSFWSALIGGLEQNRSSLGLGFL